MLLGGACTRMPSPLQPANTLFGSNVWQAPGESRSDAVARVDSTYGPISIARVTTSFSGARWRLMLSG